MTKPMRRRDRRTSGCRTNAETARLLRPVPRQSECRASDRQRPPHSVPSRGPADYFDFDVAIDPPVLRLRLYGELDMASAPALDLVHCVLPEDVRVVRIDLAGLHFCDTAGLRAIERLATGADQKHDVEVVGTRPTVRRIAQIAGLAQRWLSG